MTEMSDNSSGLRSGQSVILRDLKGAKTVYKIPALNSSTKKRCSSSTRDINKPDEALIGSNFYDVFRHDGLGTWRQVPEVELLEERRNDNPGDLMDADTTNQGLEDSNSSQNLSAAQIDSMKAEGIDPHLLIGTIIKNSESFENKTKFSQAKYIQKKMKKHLEQFTILPPTLANLSETYMAKEFKRIAGLRFDYLSTMLNSTHIRPGIRILLLDHTAGYLTGAVLQRLAGHGRVYKIGGDILSDKIAHEMNLPESYFDVIRNVPIGLFETMTETNPSLSDFDNFSHPVRRHIWVKPPQSLDEPCALRPKSKASKKRSRSEDNVDSGDRSEENSSSPVEECEESQKTRQTEYLIRQNNRAEELKDMMKSGFDAVLVALSPHKSPGGRDAQNLLQIMLSGCHHYLNPDGKLALFSLNHSLVLSAQVNLLRNSSYIAIRFEELFQREYQVLPFRTHPIMAPSVRHFSGFLLTGIKVEV